jgi:ubiquinone/menaquinone biosynthesis C-methylase UbiE
MPYHHALHRSRTLTHLALGGLALAAIVAAFHWPRIASALGGLTAGAVLLHVIVLAALLLLVRGHMGSHTAAGDTLHSARLYDAFVLLYTFGGEARLRAQTLDAAGLAPGEAVLDVCCGTGTLTLAARERVGPAGRVAGVDASAEMVARSRHKAQRLAVDVSFQEAQAQDLPFADASFDVVLCSLGFHHLPESARGAALAEMHRVLKPGGRVLLAEFVQNHGLLSRLNPVAWLHVHRHHHMVNEAAEGLARVGFADVTTGSLSTAGLGFARGVRRAAAAASG